MTTKNRVEDDAESWLKLAFTIRNQHGTFEITTVIICKLNMILASGRER